MDLASLSNTSRRDPRKKRVGRGPGSKLGKTSGRGQKGDGARSGYKRRLGKEGGQLPLYMKLPIRGFTRGRFQKETFTINLGMINKYYKEGETVSMESLKKKNILSGTPSFVKVLGDGELEVKVDFEVSAVSKSAQEKINKLGVKVTLV